MPDITTIPALRVPFIDPNTGLISREWYRFLLNLFDLTSSGSNSVSIEDLMVGPTTATVESQVAELEKAIQGLALTPVDSSENQTAEIRKSAQGLALTPIDSSESQIAEIRKAIQGLALTPVDPAKNDMLAIVLKHLQNLEVGPSMSELVSDIANLQQQIQSLSLTPPSVSSTGTVTSVDVSGGTTGLTFIDGPITTAGTITMEGTLAVGSGGTGSTSLTGAGIVTQTDGQVISGQKNFTSYSCTYAGTTYATVNAYFGENTSYAVVGGVNGVVFASGATYPGTGRVVVEPSTMRPFTDNVLTLGTASYRYTVVYATTGTINTSDATQKQQVRELNDAERRVAKTIKGLIRAFKWNEAVESKGDGARIHIGVMAQEVAEAFAAEGLDATKYGLFCQDTWTTLDGSQTRLGVRYEELLAFVLAAL